MVTMRSRRRRPEAPASGPSMTGAQYKSGWVATERHVLVCYSSHLNKTFWWQEIPVRDYKLDWDAVQTYLPCWCYTYSSCWLLTDWVWLLWPVMAERWPCGQLCLNREERFHGNCWTENDSRCYNHIRFIKLTDIQAGYLTKFQFITFDPGATVNASVFSLVEGIQGQDMILKPFSEPWKGRSFWLHTTLAVRCDELHARFVQNSKQDDHASGFLRLAFDLNFLPLFDFDRNSWGRF